MNLTKLTAGPLIKGGDDYQADWVAPKVCEGKPCKGASREPSKEYIMECNHCHDPIVHSDFPFDTDDAGNMYHYDCGMILRSKFDDARQEQMAEEAADRENH